MEERRDVAIVVRKLSNLIRRSFEPDSFAEQGVTPMQGRVICFVRHHQGQDVFQRDVERQFQIRRSTASAILQTMERDGLLTREPVPHDARLKKLVLTDKALIFSESFRAAVERIEALLTQNITPEELQAFFAVAEKLENNLKACVGTSPEECGAKRMEEK